MSNDRNRFCPPRFDGDALAVMESSHVKLAGRDALQWTVCASINIERARTADPFTAIMVECDGIIPFADEFEIQQVEHFEERHVGRNVGQDIVDEPPFGIAVTLPPDLQRDGHCS